MNATLESTSHIPVPVEQEGSAQSDVMEAPISVQDRNKGIRILRAFTFFNTWSFLPFLGTFTTMFLLKYGAKSYQIGFQRSLVYLGIPLGLLGAILSDRFDRRRLIGTAWLTRSVCVSTLIFVPFIAAAKGNEFAVWIGLAGLALFSMTRAIGAVAWLPLIRLFAPVRATKIQSKMFLLGSISSMVFYLFAFMYLGSDAPAYRFQIVYAIGVGFGLLSGTLFFFLPKAKIIKTPAVSDAYRAAWQRFRHRPVQIFIAYQILITAVFVALRTFSEVYLRKVAGVEIKYIILMTIAFIAGQFIVNLAMQRENQTRVRPMVFKIGLYGAIAALLATGMVVSYEIGHSTVMIGFAVLFFAMAGIWFNTNLVRCNTLMMEIAPESAPTTFLTFYQLSRSAGAVVGGIGVGVLIDMFQPADGASASMIYIVLFASISVLLVSFIVVNLIHPLPEKLYPKKRRATGLHASYRWVRG